MESLILHPNQTAQWQAIVSEAEHLASIQLSEELESYLVFLLIRFCNQPSIAQSILAHDFLMNLEQLNNQGTFNQQIKQQTTNNLRDIGDKCLLLTGLFPGRARRRRVRISYFVKLGQMAYSSVSYTQKNSFEKLYSSLCQHFVGLMDILQTMRELTHEQNGINYGIDLLQAEELWSDIRSQHALKVLKKVTQGFIMPESEYLFGVSDSNHYDSNNKKLH
jgi:hypothetical protein